MRTLVGLLGLLAFVAVGAYGAVRVWGIAGRTYDALTFPAHIAPGLTPRLHASDAYRITLDYLDAQTPLIAAPELHVPSTMVAIWAVTADQAAALDGCIPTGRGSGIVWVTKGRGDYLNLVDRAWSRSAQQFGDATTEACTMPGPAGTIVIDDATGRILGVYPDSGAAAPHPSPQVPLAPASAAPLPLVSASPRASASPPLPSGSGG